MDKRLNQYLSVEEAAKLLGIKEGTVRDYLSDRKLTPVKFKSLTLINKREVMMLKKKNSDT